MQDESKTKEQLICELSELRQTIAELTAIVVKNEAEQLAAERNRLFSILDGLPALVYLIAPDYSFRFSNRFFQERFDEPKQRTCYMIFYGRTTPCKSCISFQNGEAVSSLNSHRTYSNGYTYETFNYPFTDVDGSKMLLRFGIDVTDRKQAEEALELSEEKFSKAFHCSPDMFSITALKDGSFIEANDAYLDMLGYERNEVIGRTANALGVWAFPDERDQMLTLIMEQGVVRNFETHRRTKKGEILTTLLSADIIYMGGEAHLLCVHKDISDRKKMEEALRLSEERFSKAFNSSPVSMSISSLENGLFININDSFKKFIGLEHEEIIGRTALELNLWVNPSQRELIKRKLREYGFVRDVEVYFHKITGEPRLVIFSAERIDVDGEEFMLSAYMDVTEQRQMEIEMLRLDRLNLVGEMAASIGHEIRNPMTSVRGFLQLFEEKYVEDKEFLNIMIEELDRANAIITEFLSLAKNKLVELKPENLNSILNTILPMVIASARNQDMEVILDTGDIPDLLVDEKEIRQLILNMVRNGLESMPAGGVLTIRTFIQGDSVILSIKDQGHGIEPEVLDKLGTPFFTTKEKGTGLGLAVCYGIAKRHNAKIQVDATPSGTTFNICFPGYVS